MRSILSISIACASLLVATLGLAAEQSAQVDQKTTKQVLAEIERYVANDMRLKQYFLIVDPRTEEPLRLMFDHVHTGLGKHADGYAACVDFKDAGGKVFDVDIVVARSYGKLEVRKVFLHKVNGEPVAAKTKTAE